MSNPGDITPVVGTPGQQAVQIDTTQAAAQAAIDAAAKTASADSLGIDQASFDKFVKDGVMNWEAYGKERAFKDAQKPAAPVAPVTPPADPATPAADPATPDPTTDAQTAADAQAVIQNAGLDWDAVTASVVENGKLSDEDTAKLVALGIPEVVINNYITSVQKEAGAHIDTVLAGFGGEEKFNAVFEAVQKNATDEQREQIDTLLRDPATFDVGVTLANKLAGMEPAAPLQGKPVAGAQNQVASAGAEDGKPYETYQAQVAAQSDPRYKTDPAYRDSVIKRIMVTPGTNPRAHTGGM